MKRVENPKFVLFWDYELQTGADQTRDWDGIDDYIQTSKMLHYLKEFEILCCFAFLGRAGEGDSLPYSSVSQIKQVASDGHEIASHSYSHPNFANLDSSAIISELRKSKYLLEKASKQKVITFVFPMNKPFKLKNISLDGGKRPFPWVFPSKNSFSKLCALLKATGYKVCRCMDLRYKFLLVKNKEPPFKFKNLFYLKTNFKFCNFSFEKLKKSIKKNPITVLYGHPHELKFYFQRFLKLIKFLKKAQRIYNLKVTTPKNEIDNWNSML